MKEYQVYVAREGDIDAPYIWVTNPEVASRTVAKVTNEESKKHVYCEVLTLDENFRKNYTEAKHTKTIPEGVEAAVINAWYRQKLGIIKNQKVKLEITGGCCMPAIVKQIKAGLSHPDTSVRIASDLAIVSVFLGVVGLVLGIISISK